MVKLFVLTILLLINTVVFSQENVKQDWSNEKLKLPSLYALIDSAIVKSEAIKALNIELRQLQLVVDVQQNTWMNAIS